MPPSKMVAMMTLGKGMMAGAMTGSRVAGTRMVGMIALGEGMMTGGETLGKETVKALGKETVAGGEALGKEKSLPPLHQAFTSS